MNSQLQQAIKHIHTQFPEYQLYLFGSHSRGDERADSDIDICAVVPEMVKDPFDIAYEIRVELKKYLHVPLDIIVVSDDDFTARKLTTGTLENTIASEGIAV